MIRIEIVNEPNLELPSEVACRILRSIPDSLIRSYLTVLGYVPLVCLTVRSSYVLLFSANLDEPARPPYLEPMTMTLLDDVDSELFRKVRKELCKLFLEVLTHDYPHIEHILAREGAIEQEISKILLLNPHLMYVEEGDRRILISLSYMNKYVIKSNYELFIEAPPPPTEMNIIKICKRGERLLINNVDAILNMFRSYLTIHGKMLRKVKKLRLDLFETNTIINRVPSYMHIIKLDHDLTLMQNFLTVVTYSFDSDTRSIMTPINNRDIILSLNVKCSNPLDIYFTTRNGRLTVLTMLAILLTMVQAYRKGEVGKVEQYFNILRRRLLCRRTLPSSCILNVYDGKHLRARVTVSFSRREASSDILSLFDDKGREMKSYVRLYSTTRTIHKLLSRTAPREADGVGLIVDPRLDVYKIIKQLRLNVKPNIKLARSSDCKHFLIYVVEEETVRPILTEVSKDESKLRIKELGKYTLNNR